MTHKELTKSPGQTRFFVDLTFTLLTSTSKLPAVVIALTPYTGKDPRSVRAPIVQGKTTEHIEMPSDGYGNERAVTMVSKLFGGARRVDAWLQNALNNGVAYVARDAITPGEVQEYLKTEVNKNLRRDENRTVWAANLYRVELSRNDFQRLREADPHLPTELDQQLMRYIRNNGWAVSGTVTVSIVTNSKLSTGQFHTSSRFVKDNDRPSKFFDPNSSTDVPDAEPQAPQQQAHQSEPKEQEPVPQFQNNGPQSNDPWAVPEPQQPSGQPNYGNFGFGGTPGQPAGQPAPQQPAPQFGQPGQQPVQPQYQQAPQQAPQQTPQQPVGRQVTLQPRTGAHPAYEVKQGAANVIGRSKEADLVLDDPSVSRLHAEISFDGESAILVDTRSSNGTSVNGMKVFNWELADGDVIELGRSILDVQIR